jgi:glycosyltransferase involved in cell wall biosynthesis
VPRVSVLLPVRDAAPTLDACLRSIQRQDEPAWECVIVDDGSTDASPEILRGFSARDPRFRVLRSTPRGLVAALSTGLDECRAPLVARMDADDLMHRERLSRQAAALDIDPRMDAVGCHVRLFPKRALGDGMRAYQSWLDGIDSPERIVAEAFVECPIPHPSLMIRREILRSHGYRDAGWPEDYDLVLRLLGSGHRLGMVNERLLSWRHTPGRLSQRSPIYAVDRFSECKAAFLADSFLKEHDEYVLWGFGGTGRMLHRFLGALGKRPSAIVELHPGRIGNAIHGAPVIHPGDLGPPRGRLVASVAGAEARSLIRAELERRGWRETHDFVCAA